MNREIVRVDITNSPDLARLAEEVRASMQPRYLEKDGQALAMVTPVVPRRSHRRAKTASDEAAFLASAGSWKGLVDGEQLKRDLAESRRIPPRPAPEL